MESVAKSAAALSDRSTDTPATSSCSPRGRDPRRKDDHLTFRVQGRKFRLAKPRRPGGYYEIRFAVPQRLRARLKVKTAWWSLETNLVPVAIEKAKRLVQETLYGDPLKAAVDRARAGFASFYDLKRCYTPDPQQVDPRTARRNWMALMLVVREMTGVEEPDAEEKPVRCDLLTEQFGRDWQRRRVDKIRGQDELKQNTGRVTINSTLAQAKSVVGKRATHLYTELYVPDFSGFTSVPDMAVDRSAGYEPWPAEIHAAVLADSKRLEREQPLVYRAFWLMYRLGLRNVEVAAARRSWLTRFRDGTSEFDLRRQADFKTKNRRYRTIALDVETTAEIIAVIGDEGSPDEFIINLPMKTQREEICYRAINRWLRPFLGTTRNKCAYELRKEAASIIADRPESEGGGIQAAADFLGDTIAVTEAHYRGRKRRVHAVRAHEVLPTTPHLRVVA